MGSGVLGLIAGRGRFPIDLARSARRSGRRVAAVAFHGQTDPALESEAASVVWLHPGELDTAVDSLLAAGVRDAVMAGKVLKAPLIDSPEDLRLDASAARLIEGLPDRRDDSILRMVADHLASRGIRLIGQAEFVPDLLVEPGVLGRTAPTPEITSDVEFGWPIAVAIAGLDIGQTVVVKDRAVLAVEAIEGTDATIRRAGAIACGVCVVKVAKPNQDPRFDVPAIGPDTALALVDAGASALAVEAGRTLVLDREALVEVADAHGIALLGIVRGAE